ncbi:Ankyrin repeat protein 2 [Giardia muris]|uniref:Ankyrin repeat protein 2 n=1 Tax=Giardia muris TaxID=5742 RepID=A0A4Z1SRD4_GIAMU|nr:Ankyrin repeat protein 2 [Giardia muris]|eukprot:TNJ28280.1 Ankyrin repeat protein 2 [Giardia muris]
MTSLIDAAETGNIAAVRALLAQARQRNEKGETALMLAAKRGHAQIVELLRGKEAHLKDSYGYTALMHAAKYNRTEAIKLLLESERGMQNSNGGTALSIAACAGNVDAVELLRDEVHIKNNNGENAIAQAEDSLRRARTGRDEERISDCLAILDIAVEEVPLLLQEPPRRPVQPLRSLHQAVQDDDLDTIRANQSLYGVQNGKGMTALMVAAANGKEQAAKLLVEAEARMCDRSGQTALMYAVVNRKETLVELLSEYELGMRDKNGKTGLLRAVEIGAYQISRILFEEHQIPSASGKTPLLVLERILQTATPDKFSTYYNIYFDLCKLEGVMPKYTEMKLEPPKVVPSSSLLNEKLDSVSSSSSETEEESVSDSWHFKVELAQRADWPQTELFLKDKTILMLLAAAGIDAEIPNYRSELRCQDSLGRTALIYAAEKGHILCAQQLLEECTLSDNKRVTALMYAVRARANDVVALLAPKEAGMFDSSNWTATLYAVECDNPDALDALGEEVTSFAGTGPSALQLAIQKNRFACADKLSGQAGYQNSEGQTALMLAAEHGYAISDDVLRREIGYQDSNKDTALMYAIRAKNVEMAARLSAEVQRSNSLGETPLSLASALRNVPLIRVIAEALRKEGADPFEYARSAALPFALRVLLAERANQSIEEVEAKKITALMLAAYLGEGVYINALSDEAEKRDMHGETAIMYAIRGGHADILDFFKSDPAVKENIIRVLDLSVQLGQKDCVVALLPYAAKLQPCEVAKRQLTPLMLAAITGHVESLALFQDLEFAQDSSGKTALMYAAINNYFKCAQMLLSQLRMVDEHGETALMLAVKAHSTDVLPLLTEEVGLQNSEGFTALMYAMDLMKPEEIPGCLLSEARLVDKSGCRACTIAVKKGNKKLVELLLGAMRDEGDSTTSLLTIAERFQEDACLRFLLSDMAGLRRQEASLPFNILAVLANKPEYLVLQEDTLGKRDSQGRTALMHAAKKGYAICVEKLLGEQGCRDTNGNTALFYAIEANSLECVNLLTDELRLNDTNNVPPYRRAFELSHVNLTEHLLKLAAPDSTSPTDAAYRLGEQELLRRLLVLRAGQNYKNWEQFTTLMLAVRAGDATITQAFVDELDMPSFDKRKAISLAFDGGNSECIQIVFRRVTLPPEDYQDVLPRLSPGLARDLVEDFILAAASLTREEFDDGKWTFLMLAARFDQLVLMSIYENDVGKKDARGRTALMHAAEAGSELAVQKLLDHEQGAVDAENLTALAHALFARKVQCAELLVSECDIQDRTPRSVLDVVIEAGMYGFVKHVLEKPLDASKSLYELTLKQSDSRYRKCLLLGGAGADFPVMNLSDLTELMVVAISGQVRYIQQFIDQQGICDSTGSTALMYAVRFNQTACAELLLSEAGMETKNGETALMFASQADNRKLVEALLKSEEGRQTVDGRSALMFAAEAGSGECVRLLLSEVELCDKRGTTALMLAARAGHRKVVAILAELQKGRANELGETALMWAAKSGQASCLDLLCSEVKMHDAQGWTALMYSVHHQHENCLRKLVKYEQGCTTPSGMTALMLAAQEGNLTAANQLAGELRMQDAQGYTALLYALETGQTDCACFLMDEANLVTIDGRKSIDIAVERGNGTCLQMLLSRTLQLSPAEVTAKKYTALMLSAMADSVSCIRIFLSSIHAKDSDGRTALMHAAMRGNVASVGLLLDERGAIDKEGYTALMLAISEDHLECIDYLLLESPIHAADGCSALALAVRKNKEELVTRLAEVGNQSVLIAAVRERSTEYLQKYLTHIGKRDPNGMTALMHAVRSQYVEAVIHLKGESKLQNNAGQTALMFAAELGNEKLVRLLSSDELGIQDNEGRTALMYAVQRDSMPCVELLLREVNKPAADGKYAYTLAAEQKRGNIVRRILRSVPGYQPSDSELDIAIGLEDTACIQFLLRDQRNLPAKGMSELMVAALNGNERVVEMYLDQAKRHDQEGRTALMYAARKGSLPCVRLLVQECGLQDETGMTALMYAVDRNHEELVRFLAPHECGLTNKIGRTALALAFRNDKRILFRYLISEVSVPDLKGRNLLVAEKDNHAQLRYDYLLTTWAFHTQTPTTLGERVRAIYQCIDDFMTEYHVTEDEQEMIIALLEALMEAFVGSFEPESTSGIKTSIKELSDAFYEYEFSSSNDMFCTICVNQFRNCLFLPCRHFSVCSTCHHAGITANKCPLCRTQIDQVIFLDV